MAEIREMIAAVAVARQRVIADVVGIAEDRAIWQPATGEWSIAQVVEHLTLAEQGGVLSIWREAEGVRTDNPTWQGESVHRGRSIEEIIAMTWRKREDVPASAAPRMNGPLAYWIASFAACQTVLEALGQTLDGLDLEAVVVPHVISGPLDARQRLGFLRWHMDHHRPQIAEIIRLPGTRPG